MIRTAITSAALAAALALPAIASANTMAHANVPPNGSHIIAFSGSTTGGCCVRGAWMRMSGLGSLQIDVTIACVGPGYRTATAQHNNIRLYQMRDAEARKYQNYWALPLPLAHAKNCTVVATIHDDLHVVVNGIKMAGASGWQHVEIGYDR